MAAHWLAGLSADLRFAAQAVARAPRSSAVSVVTLALVLGTAAGIFSLRHGLEINGQGAADSERLVSPDAPLAPAVYRELRARARSFVAIEALTNNSPRVVMGEEPVQVRSFSVTPGWLSAMGARLAAGRPFGPADHRSGAAPVAIVSHRFAVARFGGAAAAIGRALSIDGGPTRTIVGVFVPEFEAATVSYLVCDLWFPALPEDMGVDFARRTMIAFCRLRPGVTLRAGGEELRALWAELKRGHPEMRGEGVSRVIPFRTFGFETQQEALDRMFLAAMMLLLAGCASVGAQRLGATLRRRREHALCLAVGAWGGRLLRQMFLESGLLALLGGSLGAVVAAGWIAQLHHSYISANRSPGFRNAGADLATIAFTAVLTVLVAILLTMPGWVVAMRGGIAQALKDSAGQHSGARRTRRLQDVLLALQVALATLLSTIAAAQGTRVLDKLHGKGFDARDVLYVSLEYQLSDWGERQLPFKVQVLADLAALAGVEAAAEVWPEPFANQEDERRMTVTTEGPGGRVTSGAVIRRALGGDLGGTLRVPLVRGRMLDDHEHAPVAVVTERFAARFFPGQDPLGSRFHFNQPTFRDTYRIVGVVGDFLTVADEPPGPMVYLWSRQVLSSGSVFLVRTRRPLAVMAPLMRAIVHRAEPRQPIKSAGQFADLVAEHMVSQRITALAATSFGILAALLALIGLAGATAAAVAARASEIGLRVAIGAPPAEIVFLVMRRGLLAVGGGLAIALAAVVAIRAGRLPLDVGAPLDLRLGAAVAALVAVGCLAGIMVPAWRATRRPPMQALRHE
jgi:putative ABC transport system permease protein